MNELALDGTSEPVRPDQVLRCERNKETKFPCSADHKQECVNTPSPEGRAKSLGEVI